MPRFIRGILLSIHNYNTSKIFIKRFRDLELNQSDNLLV